MAKENKIPNPWLLFGIGLALLIAGWLMTPFPLFIFFGIAPLFGLIDQAKESGSFWTKTEMVLLALTVSFLAAHQFQLEFLIISIVEAIIFTLAMAAYLFAYQILGSKVGKFTILFFWLGIEYILLNLPWQNQTIFLADALQLKLSWMKWNSHTGYLGGSLWILMVNLAFYQSLIASWQIKWPWLMLTAFLILGPLALSYFSGAEVINRSVMFALYGTGQVNINTHYLQQGELLGRTALWVSSLILLFTLVKQLIKPK